MHSEFYQEEDLKGSLSSFEQSLKHDEVKYFEVHEFEFIIDHYLSSGDIENCRNALQKAFNIHPKSHEINKRLAQLNNLEGLSGEAIKLIEHTYKAHGVAKDIDFYLILGEALLSIQKPQKAKEAFKEAIRISGDEYFDIVTTVAALYQQEGFFEQVIYHLQKIEKEDSSLLFDIALAYHNLFDFNNAIKYFKRFIPTAPFSVDVWYYIAKSYQGVLDYTSAEDALLNAIALDPEMIVYQYDLAKVYIDQSKYIESLELYKEILSKDKNVNHSIFLSIGDISYNLEQYENSLKNYEIALRLNPESSEAYHSIGQVHIELENYNLAKQNIQKAISIDASRADFFVSLGTVNQLLGDYFSAEYSFIEATKINPSLETAWNLLIDFYFFSEKPELSLKTALEAIKVLGNQNQLFSKISASYFDMKDTKNGLLYLKKALIQNRANAEFFLEYYPEGKQELSIMNLINLFE